jgi:Na+/melibiose symporter-like transporter
MAWNSIISSITVIFLPLAVTLLAPENKVAEWSRIFTGIGSLQFIMVLLFFLFCNSEPREWTKPKKRHEEEEELGSF